MTLVLGAVMLCHEVSVMNAVIQRQRSCSVWFVVICWLFFL